MTADEQMVRVSALRADGLTFRAIGEACGFSEAQARRLYARSQGRLEQYERGVSISRQRPAASGYSDLRPAHVGARELPLLTMAGVIWRLPAHRQRGCERCGLLAPCGEAVARGDFAGCESPLMVEMIDEQEQANGAGD